MNAIGRDKKKAPDANPGLCSSDHMTREIGTTSSETHCRVSFVVLHVQNTLN